MTTWIPILMVGIGLSPALGETHMNITQNGKATCRIYLEKDAAPTLREAAEELRNTIQKMSGAELPLADQIGEGEAVILVGKSEFAARHFGSLVKKALALKQDGFLIAAPSANVLLIMGPNDEGTYYGAVALLEKLGVRWYAPGEWGEEVPSRRDVVWSQREDLVEEPAFLLRNIWLDGTNRDYELKDFRKRHAEWAKRLRGTEQGGKDRGVVCGHYLPRIVPEKKYFEEHPEYYALRDGQRKPSHLCMSNPEVLKVAAKEAAEMIRKDPRLNGVALGMTDGLQWCECESCMERYSGETYAFVAKHYIRNNPDVPAISDLFVPFVDALGRELEKEFPDRDLRCGFYVYSTLMYPPALKANRKPLHEFIYPMMAPLMLCPLHSVKDQNCWLSQAMHEVVEGYTAISRNVLFREYDPHQAMIQELPIPMLTRIREDFPYYQESGVKGFTTQGKGSAYVSAGINYYLRYKMMWDPHQDFDALLDDYFTGMYGPASGPIRKYVMAFSDMIDTCGIHYCREDNLFGPMFPLEKVEPLGALVEEAAKLAASAPERYQRRVRMWELSHRNSMAFLGMMASSQEGDFKKAMELADAVTQVREEARAIDPDWMATKRYVKRSWFTTERRKKFDDFLAKTDGRKGTMVKWLPREWHLKHDPEKLGIVLGWAGQDQPDESWRLQNTDAMWQRKFSELAGNCWRQTTFDLNPDEAGADLQLQFPSVFSDMWVFLNGEMVAYRRPFTGWNRNWDWPYECTLPADLLKEGRNRLFVRTSSSIGAIGTFNRPFLYQAKP